MAAGAKALTAVAEVETLTAVADPTAAEAAIMIELAGSLPIPQPRQICGQQRAPRWRLIGPLEHRTYCKVAIIWDHPPLDPSRVKCGQPRRNFAVSYETASAAAPISAVRFRHSTKSAARLPAGV